MRILIGHALGGVKQQQSHIGRFNGLQGFHHRKFFNGFKHLAFATQACGIYQLELLAFTFKRDMDGVTGGAW